MDERSAAMGPDRAGHAHERPELSTGLAYDAAEDSGFRPSVRFPTAIDPPYRLLAEPLPVSCSVLPCVFHWRSPPSIPAVAPASTGCCGFAGPGPSAALDGPREHSRPQPRGRGDSAAIGAAPAEHGVPAAAIEAATAAVIRRCAPGPGCGDARPCPIPAAGGAASPRGRCG